MHSRTPVEYHDGGTCDQQTHLFPNIICRVATTEFEQSNCRCNFLTQTWTMRLTQLTHRRELTVKESFVIWPVRNASMIDIVLGTGSNKTTKIPSREYIVADFSQAVGVFGANSSRNIVAMKDASAPKLAHCSGQGRRHLPQYMGGKPRLASHSWSSGSCGKRKSKSMLLAKPVILENVDTDATIPRASLEELVVSQPLSPARRVRGKRSLPATRFAPHASFIAVPLNSAPG